MPYKFSVVSRSMRPEIFRKLLSMSAIHWLQRLRPPLPVMICRPIWAKIRFTVWKIIPIYGLSNGRYLWTLGSIRYGVVPKGYKQIYPENNVSPPLIVEGETYRYVAQIVSAPWAVADFKLINGKVVEVKNYTDH